MAEAAMSERLTADELEAGQEYLLALEKLGFEPEALAWVGASVDGKSGGRNEKRLALITSVVDRVGSRAFYALLFRAYDASITPKSINPFIVAVYSPHTHAGSSLMQVLTERGLNQLVKHVHEHPDPEATLDKWIVMSPPAVHRDGGLVPIMMHVHVQGVYRVEGGHYSAAEDLARFKRFERRLARAVA